MAWLIPTLFLDAMNTDPSPRQGWMAVLAKASLEHLEQQVQQLGELPNYRWLRSPEIGLVMVRGRIGGTGQPFNLGEMPLTRCVVQLTDPPSEGSECSITGFGYVAGRSPRHAELAALCDALLQCPEWSDRLQSIVIAPLRSHYQQRQHQQQQQTAATKVNFFTLVRGEP